jgi:hypothetical protein
MHTKFWWENLKERDHLKERGVDGRNRVERCGRFNLVQDRD